MDVVVDDGALPPRVRRDRRGALVAVALVLLALVGVAVVSTTPTDRAAAAVLADAAEQVALGSAQDEVLLAVVDATGLASAVTITEAGVRDGEPVDEPVPVGALGEMLTAAAVLRLVDAGRLDLDAPVSTLIGRRLPGVSVRHLLQHTSGLPDLSTDPGSRVRHSPENEAVLREVVAAVTGRGFEEVLESEVLKPAGLRSTSLDLTRGDVTRARVRSSPADLARLMRAWHDGTLVSGPTLAATTDSLRDVTPGGGVQMGLGLVRFAGYGPLVGGFSSDPDRYLLVMHAPETTTTAVWFASRSADVTGSLRPVARHLVG